MVAANFSQRDERPRAHCDANTLLSLLDETLSADQQQAAELHLTLCDACRKRLESLAGDVNLWSETRTAYALDEADAINFGSMIATVSRPMSRDQSTDAWLRAMLQPPRPGDPICLGRIERYRIDAVIGSGGMGVVAAGVDEQLGRPVAIKFLSPHLAGLAPARKRFTREARAVAAIVHPSIMPIYGVSETAHLPYLVMPLVGSATAGRSLQDRIDEQGPLDLESALGIAAQVAEGIAAAHQRGVIHRDIKPGNILLEENSPRILISDFGLARAIDDATVTLSGMVAGTPQYMSPEQAAGEAIGPTSDLFSLGVVLYTMLAGRPPFIADSPIAVLRKVIDVPAKPICQRVESLPPWVDQLLDRLLKKEPQDRIPSATQAAELLRRAESHVRHPSAYPLPTELRQRRPIWPMPVTFVAVPLLLVGAVMAWPVITNATTDAITPAAVIVQPNESIVAVRDAERVAPTIATTTTEPQIDLSWYWNEFAIETDQLRRLMDGLQVDARPTPDALNLDN